jgi:hypothetical protein
MTSILLETFKLRITAIPHEILDVIPLEYMIHSEITLKQAENISNFIKEYSANSPCETNTIRNCGNILIGFLYTPKDKHAWWMILTKDLILLDFRLSYGLVVESSSFGIRFTSIMDRIEVLGKLGHLELSEITRIMSSI